MLRFVSYLHSQDAVLVLIYEVCSLLSHIPPVTAHDDDVRADFSALSHLERWAAQSCLPLQVWPTCGDGLDVTLQYWPSKRRKSQVLMRHSFDADANSQPKRQKMEWPLAIPTGAVFELLIDPRSNHDCDGLYIVDIQIWMADKLVQ